MSRGKEMLQAAMQGFKQLQANQPSFLAEMRASVRQGREDLLNTLMGGLAGGTREPGAPGTPTPQLVTEALTGRDVDSQRDRLVPKATPAPQRDVEMDR